MHPALAACTAPTRSPTTIPVLQDHAFSPSAASSHSPSVFVHGAPATCTRWISTEQTPQAVHFPRCPRPDVGARTLIPTRCAMTCVKPSCQAVKCQGVKVTFDRDRLELARPGCPPRCFSPAEGSANPSRKASLVGLLRRDL